MFRLMIEEKVVLRYKKLKVVQNERINYNDQHEKSARPTYADIEKQKRQGQTSTVVPSDSGD